MKHLALFLICLALAACSGSTTTSDPVAGSPQGVVDDTPDDNVEDDDPVDDEVDDPVEPGTARLAVLSNRPDLISAGDVLIEVVLGAAGDFEQLSLLRNGDDVTAVLDPTADNPLRYLGVVDGLRLGENTLAVNLGNSVTVTNHPIGGPVFTGAQITPWQCQGSAIDDQCNEPVQYSFLYRSTEPDPPECERSVCPSHSPGFRTYDPENPPDDVAMTTTDTGETIPFIVRRESGYMARDQYAIYTLFKPAEVWTAVEPQSQWNGRLLVTHGGNCRGNHSTSRPRVQDYAGTIPANPSIADSYITGLSRGWSVLSTSQLNLGHNCNVALQAESLMMVKERYVEQYGELRYTVGTGCSGGAITQNMIANAYPGLYNGLLTTCTYPDVMSTATQFADYHILLKYFRTRIETPDTSTPDSFDDFISRIPTPPEAIARDGTAFSAAQQNAIYGHENGIVNASLADSELFSEAVDPQSSCGGVAETVANDENTRYEPETNPRGTRCDVLTFMKSLVGVRQPDRRGPVEQAIMESFAGFPLGNEGVQYGLLQLRDGTITPAQFVALNTNVGAVDTDLNLTPRKDPSDETSPRERLSPDMPALTNAYRTGILNTIVNMDTVPIINMTGPDPGIAHDSVHGYWLRYRFEREFPDISREDSNFVMWGGPTPLIGDPNYMNQSLLAMADWLDAIEADTSNTPIAEKIRNNKPDSVTDQCSSGSGEAARPGMCTEEEMAVYGTPRTEAGDDIYGDMVQCRLRPFSRDDDYGPGNAAWDLEPDSASWLALEATFATGVCDFTPVAGPLDDPRDPELARPLGWTETVTWLRYGDELGKVVTGGTQMDAADYPRGWASPAFSGAWAPGFAAGE